MGCLGSLIGMIFAIVSAVFGLVFGIVGSVLSGVGVLVLVLLPVLTLVIPVLLLVGVLWFLSRLARGPEEQRTYRTVRQQRPPKEEQPIDDDSEVVDVEDWEEFPNERNGFEQDDHDRFKPKGDDQFKWDDLDEDDDSTKGQ